MVSGTRNERCKAMNTTTVNFLMCFALFVLVVALTLVALMLVVPLVTPELTPSGYY
jgi:hypothetical protein